MIVTKAKENKFYEKKKVCTEKNLVQMKMIKLNLNYTVKSETLAIAQENLEELLTVFAI